MIICPICNKSMKITHDGKCSICDRAVKNRLVFDGKGIQYRVVHAYQETENGIILADLGWRLSITSRFLLHPSQWWSVWCAYFPISGLLALMACFPIGVVLILVGLVLRSVSLLCAGFFISMLFPAVCLSWAIGVISLGIPALIIYTIACFFIERWEQKT